MIKLFRKIRQRLLTENKFNKYLLYAFGEIVLVVIGILIALQINDWSEHRKLLRTNGALMERMVDELQINLYRLHYLDTAYTAGGVQLGYNPMLMRIDTALSFINDELSEEQLVWLLETPYLYDASLYNLSSSVYKELLSSGRFYSLGSDSLSTAIQLYYQLIDREEKYAVQWHEKAESAWEDCKYGFLDLKSDYLFKGESVLIDHSWYGDSKSKEYINLKLALRESYHSTERNRRHALAMMAKSIDLINILQKEIARLK
jgi:hypothetical protein